MDRVAPSSVCSSFVLPGPHLLSHLLLKLSELRFPCSRDKGCPRLLKGVDFYIMGARGLSPTPAEQVHGSECVLQSMPCRESPWLPPLPPGEV